MKLLTKQLLNKIPKPYSQENELDPICWVKLFTPWSNWDWYIIEYNPETRTCLGWVVGFESEMGYFSLDEIEQIRGIGGLKIERDRFFKPKKLSEVKGAN
jgi:hypothetical protein